MALLRHYTRISSLPFPHNVSKCVNEATTTILSAASISIPEPSGRPRKGSVPWWNEEISEAVAIQLKKRTFNRFRRNPASENWVQASTCFWHSWQDFVLSLTPDTKIWGKIRQIVAESTSNIPRKLAIDCWSASEPLEMAEIMATHFQNVSSFKDYSTGFQANKNALKKPLDLTASNSCK